MEVKFLTEDLYGEWDNFVDDSPQGSIFCYSWWLKTVTNDDFKICCIFGDDGKINCGMVLPFFSKKIIRRPPCTYYQGFLFYNPERENNIRLQKYLTAQKEYTNTILDYLDKYHKYFKVDFHYRYNYWSPLLWRGFKQSTSYTYIIDYTNYIPEEEFKRFSKGHKWIINKVEKKSDLKVEPGTIDEFLIAQKKMAQIKGININEAFFRRLHKEIQDHDAGIIFKITDSQHRIHAIEYYLYDKKEAYYWSGASDHELRDSGGHTELTWYGIKYFSTRVKTFNFCGSMIEAVEKNFRNFSAIPVPYYYIEKLPAIYRALSELKKSLH